MTNLHHIDIGPVSSPDHQPQREHQQTDSVSSSKHSQSKSPSTINSTTQTLTLITELQRQSASLRDDGIHRNPPQAIHSFHGSRFLDVQQGETNSAKPLEHSATREPQREHQQTDSVSNNNIDYVNCTVHLTVQPSHDKSSDDSNRNPPKPSPLFPIGRRSLQPVVLCVTTHAIHQNTIHGPRPKTLNDTASITIDNITNSNIDVNCTAHLIVKPSHNKSSDDSNRNPPKPSTLSHIGRRSLQIFGSCATTRATRRNTIHQTQHQQPTCHTRSKTRRIINQNFANTTSKKFNPPQPSPHHPIGRRCFPSCVIREKLLNDCELQLNTLRHHQPNLEATDEDT